MVVCEENNDDPVGYETCEEREYEGGDSDDVWFYYHRICYGQFVESCPRWAVELHRSIRCAEALEEEYLCDFCGRFLVERGR